MTQCYGATATRGFTLVELMIAVAVIAVLAAIAIPIYNGYLQTSREGVLVNNIATIQVFQEDVRMRTGSYVAGNYDVSGGDTSLSDPPLNWDPRGEDSIVYSVALVGADNYSVTATDEAGITVCRQFPDNVPCP